jgi:AraC-like DNA-binding protein
MTHARPALSLLAYPYLTLRPFSGGPGELRPAARQPGTALVWSMADGRHRACADMVADRPGGLSLLVILPPGETVVSDPHVMHEVQRARPHGILPFHPEPSASDLAQVLRTPPADLGGEVTDYLRWRGLGIDRDTTHIIRRIIDLSAELRSVSAVSRGMYLSRRALGRRLMSRGLPVPSHWLQLGRLLRVALRLQNGDSTVSSIAFDLGYPDGFSASNQMERLIGHRPSEVRARLGWEWMLEAWLRKEAERGGLTPTLSRQCRGNVDPKSVLGPPRRIVDNREPKAS